MKELREIAQAWESARRQWRTAALATVVQVEGSSYRRPGARMLILPDGQTVGSVSGGCLEADVVERARRIIETGERAVVTYDTTDDSDIVFGVGLGCQGIVWVLIEPLSPNGDAAVSLPVSLLSQGKSGVLATVYGTNAQSGVGLGDRFLLEQDAMQSGGQAIEIAGGRADVFFEVIQPPMPLVIFGAGNDAQPLARLAQELGWHVTVADSRSAFVTPDRFPNADVLASCTRDGLPPSVVLSERTAVVVMTHNYLQDRALLASLLPSPVRYLGVLGPARRTRGLLQELRDEGLTITDSMLARLHSPIGLDIGGETPEQIALAIAAEIQAVMAGRAGGFLRERRGPIYNATSGDASPEQVTDAERLLCPLSV